MVQEGEQVLARKESTVYYPGLRHGLTINHKLRSLGQTRECCVAQFYSRNGHVVEKKNPTSKGLVSAININKMNSLKFCYPIGTELNELKNWMMHGRGDWDWYSYSNEDGNYVAEDFDLYLYYPHCDFRSIHNYDRIGDRPATGLLTDTEYLEAARQHLTTKGKAAQKKVKDRNFGIYGAWVYVFLNYSDYRLHSQYGAMHCLSGICSLIMMHISQSRSTKMSSLMKSYLRNRNMHPYCTRTEEPHIPWLLKTSDENRFDCIMASCIKPTGMHEEKAPTSIYDKFGKLKCAEDINIFAYFLPYLVSTVGDHFSKAYKSFICMLSNNVREIIQRFIPAAEVGPLQNRYVITCIIVVTVTSSKYVYSCCN